MFILFNIFHFIIKKKMDIFPRLILEFYKKTIPQELKPQPPIWLTFINKFYNKRVFQFSFLALGITVILQFDRILMLIVLFILSFVY